MSGQGMEKTLPTHRQGSWGKRIQNQTAPSFFHHHSELEKGFKFRGREDSNLYFST